jgi:hypothetical protein
MSIDLSETAGKRLLEIHDIDGHDMEAWSIDALPPPAAMYRPRDLPDRQRKGVSFMENNPIGIIPASTVTSRKKLRQHRTKRPAGGADMGETSRNRL